MHLHSKATSQPTDVATFNVRKLWEVMAPKSSQSLAGEPDDVAKTHKVKEKKDGAPEKLPGSAREILHAAYLVATLARLELLPFRVSSG